MPGPASSAITARPRRRSSSIARNTISPCPTCTTMFRAISEIAVAINVASVRLNPSWSASARAWARAETRSSSAPTRTSSGIRWPSLDEAVEGPDSVVQIECGPQRLEVEAELDHRDRHVGLDADDHRLGSPHERRLGDRAQGPSDEGVDDVHGGHIDDQAPGAMVPDAPRKVVA